MGHRVGSARNGLTGHPSLWRRKELAMLLEDEVALIRKLPLFSGVSPERLKLLCFASSRGAFSSGEVLFAEGEPSFGAYVILSGTVEIYSAATGSRSTKTGTESKVAIVGQSSMLSGSPRHATITALTAVETLRINTGCFMQLMTACPKSSERILQSLGAQLAEHHVLASPKAIPSL
jgi:CRP-like cAMP-binding protein